MVRSIFYSERTFNIGYRYDDGEKETRLEAASLVRLVPGTSGKKMAHSPEPPSKLVLGSKVEGNCKGKDRWYPGRIARVNLDKSFDIDYDGDGEKETRLEAALVRLVPGGSGKKMAHSP